MRLTSHISAISVALFLSFPSLAAEGPQIRLIPQELYGEQVLDMLNRKGHQGTFILQFNFFTDNPGDTYPKQFAQELVRIRESYPMSEILMGLESRKGLEDPSGKGPAQRNATTAKFLRENRINVRDIYGLVQSRGSFRMRENGVSHVKSISTADELTAGSSNWTKQSTDVGANNEMNIWVQSEKIVSTYRDYVREVTANPSLMANLEVEDGPIRMLTDTLHLPELLKQIAAAQKGDRLAMSMYQLLFRRADDVKARQVFQALLAAHERGVQLEVFLNRALDLDTQNTQANLSIGEKLLSVGVAKVYFDPEVKISHSKFLYRISADGKTKVAMISSVNIYDGDFDSNHQLTWVVQDERIVDQLDYYFKQQIAYDGVLLSRIPEGADGLRFHVPKAPGESVWNKPVAPKRMLRVWRGFKQDNVLRGEFEAKVNHLLIPATTEVAAGRGLKAYLPSFFSKENKPKAIPDEVAILDYLDEESYNAGRVATEAGRAYGPLHFSPGLFTKKNAEGYSSGSLVAQEYVGRVEVAVEGRAYILGNPKAEWQKGFVSRRTLLPVNAMNPAGVENYLKAISDASLEIGLNTAVVVVDPQYLMLMLNFKSETAAQTATQFLQTLERNVFKEIDQIYFSSQAAGSTNLKSNSGVNVKFDSDLLSRKDLIGPLMREIGGDLQDRPRIRGVSGSRLGTDLKPSYCEDGLH